jgi:hypothetical protein
MSVTLPRELVTAVRKRSTSLSLVCVLTTSSFEHAANDSDARTAKNSLFFIIQKLFLVKR